MTTVKQRNRESTTGSGENRQVKRFKRLVTVIEKGLSESCNSINTRAAVSECYGEDTSIFADSVGGEEGATDMLANLIDGVIERSNEKLKNDIDGILEKYNIKTDLCRLDRAIGSFERRDQKLKEKELEDKQSAKEASRRSKLPTAVTAADALAFHGYKAMIENRDKMISEIATLNEENDSMFQKIQSSNEIFEERMAEMKKTEHLLESAADLCSFNGIS